MNIVLYLDPFYAFMQLPADEMLMRMMLLFGWLPIAFVIMWGIWQIWADLYVSGQYASKQKYVFLAIDVPKGNDQSPLAVENFLTYLAGAHSNPNIIDVYWDGVYQLPFSLEIASIDGYTQFVVRTPAQFRNLVESGLYAVYPDSEITEINDYTTGCATHFPNDEYDVWGSEFVLANPLSHHLPLKTYKEFEHIFGKPEHTFRDPMASLMDLCSSLRKGEQLWYQIILVPIDQAKRYVTGADKTVAKIMGEKEKSKPHWLNGAADIFAGWLAAAAFIDLRMPAEEKKSEALKMMDLKPAQKKMVESIQDKIAKQGFEFKIRMVYMAKKDVMNKAKVVNGFVGFIKQFGANDLNSLKPDMSVTATSTAFLFKQTRLNERKNKIVDNYISRSAWSGRLRGLLNIEEVATLWHFPIEASVKAPLIQKTPGRKAEPPTTLPIGEEFSTRADIFDEIFADEQPKAKPAKSVNLPTAEDIFAMEGEAVANGDGQSIDTSGNQVPDNLPFV